MSKPVNTVALGGFVVGAFLILFAALFYLSGNVFNRNSEAGLMVFDGSVKGLKVGAPVAFKGVQIGEVTDFDVIVDLDTYEVLTPVGVRIYSDRVIGISGGEIVKDSDYEPTPALIERGLRAQLQLQSLLTGLLYIQLDFHPGTEPRFTAKDLAKYDISEDINIVPTIPTDFERMARGLQEIDFSALADNVQTTLNGLDRLINDPDLQALPEDISSTLAAIEDLSRRLDGEIQTLSPGVNELVTEAGGTMKTLNADMPQLSADAQNALREVAAALAAAETTLGNVDYLLSDDSAVLYEITKAAQELAAAGRSLQSLAETLETQPESLLKGKSPLGN
jgi:paraquat-inducible protein B